MQEVQVTELASFIASNPEAVLLDVREPWEVALAAICLTGIKSLAIPMNEVPQHLAELSSNQPVVCICHHGMRSAQVARYLAQAGLTEVVNLRGGIDAWSTQVDPQVPRY